MLTALTSRAYAYPLEEVSGGILTPALEKLEETKKPHAACQDTMAKLERQLKKRADQDAALFQDLKLRTKEYSTKWLSDVQTIRIKVGDGAKKLKTAHASQKKSAQKSLLRIVAQYRNELDLTAMRIPVLKGEAEQQARQKGCHENVLKALAGALEKTAIDVFSAASEMENFILDGLLKNQFHGVSACDEAFETCEKALKKVIEMVE